MASIPQFDPGSTEIVSPLIAGLSEGLNVISTILNLTTETITDTAMPEASISESDRYRIYQVANGKRLWLSSPAPVIKKNGSVITPAGAGFTIDYVGGSIIFDVSAILTSSDTVTVSATRIASASTEIETVKGNITTLQGITGKIKGYYATVGALETAHPTGSDGDFAIIGGTVDSIYMWDSNGSAWKDIYKTVDLSTYYTKTEADNLLNAKQATIVAHGSTSASDLYYYGGRKDWQELTAKVRAVVLTGIDVATSAVITASDSVLGALGKLQAQITGKPFLSSTGDPAITTVGTIGQRFVNTSTGNVFRCTAISGSDYTWVQQGSTNDLVASAVTNAKLANMDNGTIKGNVSGSAAAPSDLTASQVRGIITEGTTEVDAIADEDKFVIEDVSASAGVRTKHVLWSSMKADMVYSNLCTNPCAQVWQNDKVISGLQHRSVLADGWLFGTDGGSVWEGSRSSDVPAGTPIPFSINLECTTASATPINSHLRWAVLGAEFAPYKDENIQLAFWVKASKAGVNCIVANNSYPRDASYVAEFTINAPDTWEHKVITIPFADRVGSLWNYDQGYGFGIRFCVVTTPGSSAPTGWNNGNYFSSPNQVNNGDAVGNYYRITGVQLCPNKCPEFTPPAYEVALNYALRQYRIIDTDIAGVQVIGFAPTADSCNFDFPLPFPMYAPPTMTINGSLDTDITIQDMAGNAVTGSTLASFARSKAFAKWTFSKTAGFVANQVYATRLVTTSGKIVFDGHLL